MKNSTSTNKLQKIFEKKVKVVISKQELNLTTGYYKTLEEYMTLICYYWSKKCVLTELSLLGKETVREYGGDFDGWNKSIERTKINTIAKALYAEKKTREQLPYLTHIVLQYQISPGSFYVIIYPLNEILLQAIKEENIQQEVEFDKDMLPIKVTTIKVESV